MQISQDTITILKNFCLINKSIYLDEPGYIKSSSDAGHILGICKIEEELPVFGIANLVEFVNIVNSFKTEPDFEFDEAEVTISQGKYSVTYKYLDKDCIYKKMKEADAYAKFNDFSASFNLPKDDLDKMIRTAKILGINTARVALEDGKGQMFLFDKDNSLANKFTMDIEGNGTCDTKFLIDNLIMIPNEYDVFIDDKKVKFMAGNLFYFIQTLKG